MITSEALLKESLLTINNYEGSGDKGNGQIITQRQSILCRQEGSNVFEEPGRNSWGKYITEQFTWVSKCGNGSRSGLE